MPQDLDQGSLQALLETLSRHSTEPGQAYELLRVRLIRFFQWNHCFHAEDLADTALDRLAAKIAAGEPILDPGKFVHGIARMLVHEQGAQQMRENRLLSWLRWSASQRVSPDEAELSRQDALSHCLDQLPTDQRRLLERYYTGDTGVRIQNREQLARELGIGINALRNRALRLRQQLESCTSRRLGRLSSRDGSQPAITRRKRRIL
jgi:DNA-directed RNA polymerase specialized sigma24 family protein